MPTPEPSGEGLKTIGTVKVSAEYDYYVDSLTTEGNLVHLMLRPVRDPERNRLREVFADKTTYEVTRLIAHDRLHVNRDIFDTTFDIYVGSLEGHPVVTAIHGEVGKSASGTEYVGDGKTVDYTITNIKFLEEMPGWYFNARLYASRQKDLPK